MTEASRSVLENAPREGFYQHAARFFNTVIPVDEVSALDAQLLIARMDFAKAVSAVKDAKQTPVLRRAHVVSRSS